MTSSRLFCNPQPCMRCSMYKNRIRPGFQHLTYLDIELHRLWRLQCLRSSREISAQRLFVRAHVPSPDNDLAMVNDLGTLQR